MAKGFQVTNQKVSVSIGLNGRLKGYTELTLLPLDPLLQTIWLHAARDLTITHTSLRLPTVIPLAFSHLPPNRPQLTQPDNIHTYPEMKRNIWRSDNEAEEGELGIALPKGCIVRVGGPAGARTPAAPTPGAKGVLPLEKDEYEPVTIAIEYEVSKPGAGIVVIGPDEANPSRFPHVLTSPLSPTAARTWVPCIDTPRERCSWDLELVVPRVLASAPPESGRRKRRRRETEAEIEKEEKEGEKGEKEKKDGVVNGEKEKEGEGEKGAAEKKGEETEGGRAAVVEGESEKKEGEEKEKQPAEVAGAEKEKEGGVENETEKEGAGATEKEAEKEVEMEKEVEKEKEPVEEDDDSYDEEDDIDAEWPISVAASGELVEQVVHPDRSDRVIWHFVQVAPVSVQQIAWAVGPFVVTEIKGSSKAAREGREGEVFDDEDDLAGNDGPTLHALCLPGREEEMEYSVGVIRQAMEFYTANFGSFPFVTYTVAFVDSLASAAPNFHSAGLTLLSSDILHPPSVIDQAYETRHLLAHSLAVQWSGVNLVPRTPSDSWLVVGIALHMTGLFVRHLWGNNEYRFRLRKDMNRCVELDIQFEPVCVPARLTLPEPNQMQFIALKAPLVLYILDKHLRKAGTSLGLDKVLPKLFLDALTSDAGGNALSLSTTSFMRVCRKSCGGSSEALKTFFDQWVYGSGCPTFEITATFNRKKMAVELNVTQRCYAYAWSQKAPWEAQGHLRPIPLFDGQMTIRIHEADGTPYEHVLGISDAFKRHEVPFNTKYKRVRRNTKRYQARQAAATAAALGDADAQEDLGLIDVGFSLGMWEDEDERERWRVADWTEEDDNVMSQATYEWIRIDADLEWIAIVKFAQPDFMWISQLQRDRDVVAQLEAIHALSSMPSPIVSSNLCKTVLVNNYFVRIRMEAALALISCATIQQDYLGLFQLFKLFQNWFCFEPDVETQDPFGFRCIPKTNDFGDFTLYFLKKTLLTAISMVRDERGQTPPVIQQFLVDLLAYNDNLGNKYSDAYYLTSVMHALSHALVKVLDAPTSSYAGDVEIETNENLAPAVKEVERYLSADRLVPSYHNVVTVAGIEFMLKLTLASLIPEDRMRFFVYTRDGNYPPVRIAAFDALLLLNPLQDVMPLVRYLFSVMRDDSSRLVQRRLAASVLESLPILAAVQDLAPPDPGAEDSKDEKKRDELANVLKALRKKPGRSMNYRTSLLTTLVHPDVDPEVRLCCLKICEATVRPEGEPLPKMRFRLPPTPAPQPVLEAPPLPPPTPSESGGPISMKLKLGTPKITIPSHGAPDYMQHQHQPYHQQQQPYSSYNTIEEEQPSYDNYYSAPLPPAPPVVKPPKQKKEKDPNRLPKIPKLVPAQANGMSSPDVTACKSLIKKLTKEKKSFIFRAPVDPIKAGAPDYFEKVPHPMDLGTMSAKLQAGVYPDRFAFRDDFKLIISNAKLYNGATSPIGELANDLDQIFEKHWMRVQATLMQLEAVSGGGGGAARAGAGGVLPAIPLPSLPSLHGAPSAYQHQSPPPPPPPAAAAYDPYAQAQAYVSQPKPPKPYQVPPPPPPLNPACAPSYPQAVAPPAPAPAPAVVAPPPAQLPQQLPPPPPPAAPKPTISLKFSSAPRPTPPPPPPAPPASQLPQIPSAGTAAINPAALPAMPPPHPPPAAAAASTPSFPASAAPSPAFPGHTASPSLPPPPPPPKTGGFKIKLGGASLSSASAQAASAPPKPTPPLPSQSNFSPDVDAYSPAPPASSYGSPAPGPSSAPISRAPSFDYNPYSPAAYASPSLGGGAGGGFQAPPVPKKKKKDKHRERERDRDSSFSASHGGGGGESGGYGSGSDGGSFRAEKAKKVINYAEPTEDDFDEPEATIPVNTFSSSSSSAGGGGGAGGAMPLYQVPQRPEILDTPMPPPPTKWVKADERVDVAKAKAVIQKVRGIREAFFFQYPVEAVGPLATYYDEISHPMDLDTLLKRLENGHYSDYSALFADFDLIIFNCERFNTPNTEPIWHVHVLERAWRNEWEKASKLSYNTKRSLGAFLKKLSEEGCAAPFNVPIADLVQQVPNYYTFIPADQARDLLMLRRGVEKDKYLTIEALEADFDLLVSNCYRFNGTESQISYSARELSDKFKKGILRIKTDSAKQSKRTSTSTGGGPSKKQRF